MAEKGKNKKRKVLKPLGFKTFLGGARGGT